MINKVGRGGCYALYFMVVCEGRKWYNQKNKSEFADEFLELSLFFKAYTVNCYAFSLVFALMGSLQGKVFLNVSNRCLQPYPRA